VNQQKILLFQRIVPHYRIPIFEILNRELNIIVCSSPEKKNATLKSEVFNLNYPHEIIGRVYFPIGESVVLQNLIRPLFKYRPKIIISEYSPGYLTFWLLFVIKSFLNIKLIVWSHGIQNEEMQKPFNSFKSKISLFVFRKVDAIILYSNERANILGKKIDKKKIFVAQNTINTSGLLKLRENFKRIGKSKIKKELNFTNKYNLIYIGRFLKSKRIDLILATFFIINKRLDIGLHFIGSGPETNVIEPYLNMGTSIYAYGGIIDEETSGKYLYASDILINPGYVGLSIIHGMCFEKPIVTCNIENSGSFHGPEIEYLIDGYNGLLVSQKPEDISDAIYDLLTNNKKLEELSKNALHTVVQNCNLGIFTKGFENAINFVLRI